jgi:hypothetical protein
LDKVQTTFKNGGTHHNTFDMLDDL